MERAVVVAIRNLDGRHEARLARFALQQGGERFAVVVEGEFAEMDEQRGADLDGGERPAGESGAGSGDSIVDVLGGRDGSFPERLEGRGVGAVVGFGGAAGFTVDDIGEGGPIYLAAEAIGDGPVVVGCAIRVSRIRRGHGRSSLKDDCSRTGEVLVGGSQIAPLFLQ